MCVSSRSSFLYFGMPLFHRPLENLDLNKARVPKRQDLLATCTPTQPGGDLDNTLALGARVMALSSQLVFFPWMAETEKRSGTVCKDLRGQGALV